MNIQELVKAAKAAIAAGNLEEATKLTEQAKALKALVEFDEPEENEALTAAIAERDALKAQLDAAMTAPANKKAGVAVDVIEDEADKAIKARPYKGIGDLLVDVRRAAQGKIDDRLKGLRSDDPMDEGGFSLSGALGDSFVGSLPAAKAMKAAPSGLGESLPQYGGILLENDRNTSIMSRVYDSSYLLGRVPTDTVGPNSNGMTYYAEDETSRATGSRRGGVQFYWVAENSTIGTSRPKFRKVKLSLKKAAAALYATDEQMQDTAALESYVMRVLPEEIRWGIEDSILNGTGGGMPEGIENSGAVISVPKETGQAADTVVYENLVKMWARLWSRSRLSSLWLISQDVLPQLMTMTLNVGTAGVPVYLPPGGASGAPYGTLFNRPVIEHESCDNLGDVGDIQLIDPSQYQMIEKGGMQSASSIHVRFLEDEMTYRFTIRIDGQSMWNSALTPANGGDTVSPFINLAERA
jgi:HK97 family phage major capsid protein